ncbi:hypothetical protein B0H10DRAFT_2191081 [Mycena sp. CBHHK59/15]|nr:hypothetical protein B0H10DRAFT_2191081 [Mycena sp. CBHHK59/15]
MTRASWRGGGGGGRVCKEQQVGVGEDMRAAEEMGVDNEAAGDGLEREFEDEAGADEATELGLSGHSGIGDTVGVSCCSRGLGVHGGRKGAVSQREREAGARLGIQAWIRVRACLEPKTEGGFGVVDFAHGRMAQDERRGLIGHEVGEHSLHVSNTLQVHVGARINITRDHATNWVPRSRREVADITALRLSYPTPRPSRTALGLEVSEAWSTSRRTAGASVLALSVFAHLLDGCVTVAAVRRSLDLLDLRKRPLHRCDEVVGDVFDVLDDVDLVVVAPTFKELLGPGALTKSKNRNHQIASNPKPLTGHASYLCQETPAGWTRDWGCYSILFRGIFLDFLLASKITTLVGSGGDPLSLLKLQRDGFRKHLKACRLTTGPDVFGSIIAWLPGVIKHKSDASSHRAEAYFRSQVVTLRTCMGLKAKALANIVKSPVDSSTKCKEFDGNLKRWLRHQIAVNQSPTKSVHCWRTRDGANHCSGVADRVSFRVSLPIALVLELNDEDDNVAWDFPAVLQVPSNNFGDDDIVYDLVGHGLYSSMEQHFVVRYFGSLPPERRAVYMYDGMKNRGYSGGLAAQNHFMMSQRAVAQRIHGLSFDSDPQTPSQPSDITLNHRGFLAVPAEDRFWLKNPYDSRTRDYIFADDMARDKGGPAIQKFQSHKPIKGQLGRPSGLETSSSDPGSPVENAPKPPRLIRPKETRDPNPRVQGVVAAVANEVAVHTKTDLMILLSAICAVVRLHLGIWTPKSDAPMQPVRASKRLESSASVKPIRDRIGPGKGVLAKNGKYWYPARLIRCVSGPRSKERVYAVKWWQGCTFHSSSIHSDNVSLVNEASIFDDLWGDRNGRRKIRLGHWTHACEVPSAEDILANPTAIPYNEEVNTALSPFCDILREALISHQNLFDADIPTSEYGIKADGTMLLGSHPGDLSVMDRARVMNWFERHVADGDVIQTRPMWIG